MNKLMIKDIQNIFLNRAIIAAMILHLLILMPFLLFLKKQAEPLLIPLAIVDFSLYDPSGGQAGNGTESLQETFEEVTPAEEIIEEITPEEQSIEEIVPQETEKIKIIESQAKESPAPPKVKEIKKPEKKVTKKPANKQNKVTSSPQSVNSGRSVASGGEGNESKTGSGGNSGSGKGNPDALKAYHAKILKKLKKYKKYPPAAESKRQEGTVMVNFTVNKNGQVSSPRITKSSGHLLLDQESLALLKRVSPFPEIPKEIAETTLNLTVPIQFYVK